MDMGYGILKDPLISMDLKEIAPCLFDLGMLYLASPIIRFLPSNMLYK